jgi:hypothetical protein
LSLIQELGASSSFNTHLLMILLISENSADNSLQQTSKEIGMGGGSGNDMPQAHFRL